MHAHIQWIELDGNSLSIESLIKIGKGELRVKVWLLTRKE